MIHPTALVDSTAEIGANVEIGPYCLVGPGVRLGDGCKLLGHVTLAGPSVIGPENIFYPYSVIGQRSQDLKYAGEPTFLEVGSGNTFREFCTIHRATKAGGRTVVGSHGNFLAYSHIAHDCVVGDHVIFSNNGTLAGHVVVGDHAIVGGLSAVHQFCRIGAHSMIGGCAKIVQDVPPYMIADGNPAEIRGVNSTGLDRRGFDKDTIRALREAHRILWRRDDLNTSQAVAALENSADLSAVAEIRILLDFIRSSERGIIR